MSIQSGYLWEFSVTGKFPIQLMIGRVCAVEPIISSGNSLLFSGQVYKSLTTDRNDKSGSFKVVHSVHVSVSFFWPVG